jgi:hypothetical protein
LTADRHCFPTGLSGKTSFRGLRATAVTGGKGP